MWSVCVRFLGIHLNGRVGRLNVLRTIMLLVLDVNGLMGLVRFVRLRCLRCIMGLSICLVICIWDMRRVVLRFGLGLRVVGRLRWRLVHGILIVLIRVRLVVVLNRGIRIIIGRVRVRLVRLMRIERCRRFRLLSCLMRLCG